MTRHIFVAQPSPTDDAVVAHLTRLPDWDVVHVSDGRTVLDHGGSFGVMVVPSDVAPTFLRPHMRDTAHPLTVLPYGPPECMEAALLMGAEDYLCEPFSVVELVVRAARVSGVHARRDMLGDVVQVAGNTVVLTGVQRELWLLLVRNAGRIVDRSAIMTQCRMVSQCRPSSRTVDMAVSRLRRAVRGSSIRIETVRGRGYRLLR